MLNNYCVLLKGEKKYLQFFIFHFINLNNTKNKNSHYSVGCGYNVLQQFYIYGVAGYVYSHTTSLRLCVCI